MTISAEQRTALEQWLDARIEMPGGCRISAIERMSMGQSRAMYRVDLARADDEGAGPVRRIVLRVEQWGLLGSNGDHEVQVMQALWRAGYPIAEVIGHEPSSALLGQPFFAMEHAPGTSVFARASLDAYVQALDRLHRLDPKAIGVDFLPVPAGPRGAALAQVEALHRVYLDARVGEPSPLVEEAAEWLRANAPESARLAIVHGDPGPGNYLHCDGALGCIVDWEFTHIGDPDEDWAYLISMRGMGVMAEAAWIDYLREQVGVTFEPFRLRWWKALNFFKGVCIDQTALKTYVDRSNRAPNMLAIGTAVHLSALKRLSAAIRGSD